MTRLSMLARRYIGLVVAVGLLLGVYLLPPDTSLAEVRRLGQFSACIPEARPPLVTGDPAAPGIEIELLKAIAGELGVRLSLNVVAAMGRDFNPASWRITRAQCAVVAGGLVDTIETRSFLAAGPSFGETGWMAVSPSGATDLSSKTVGVFATEQGADRLALSSYLRAAGAKIAVVRSAEALAEGLAGGTLEVGIADALVLRPLIAANAWTTVALPPELASHRLILGLWKGDLTLKRAIEDAFARVVADGRLAAILERYGSV